MANAPIQSTSSTQFLEFVQAQALAARSGDAQPGSLADWQLQREKLRERLIASWGGFPAEKCDLDPQIIGTLERDGYRVEKLLLQTRPGILMTANAYVPSGEERRAAVLCVHGHWKGAKQDPVVQSRCIGLAKLGFFVLVVDAFGAGERGIGKALGEYHGEMCGAMLFPTGLALAGLQVWDNIRAIDYLQSRPEVDPERIGVTGASGGGNQSMYIGAIDDRLKAVVPVCSVGTYQSYLGAACCMCEVTPGALGYTEEAGVLSLVAPRALMLISATRDALQFSPGEAAKSLTAARTIYQLYGHEVRATHVIFESNHDYSQPMREAMYGWMMLHLRGAGEGGPIPEPVIQTEDPETLRCFPGESRPEDFLTLPKYATAEAQRLLSLRPLPDHLEHWQMQEASICGGLSRVLGGFPAPGPLNLLSEFGEDSIQVQFDSEPGIRLHAQWLDSSKSQDRLAILLDLDKGRMASESTLAAALKGEGWSLATVDLRATAGTAVARDAIGRAPDHNSAEWSLWLGRPLLGQWTWDVVRMLQAIEMLLGRRYADVALVGHGTAGLVALTAGALSTRFTRIATTGSLATYETDVPYENQRLGLMAPGILRDAGDICHLAATISPRRLVIANPVLGSGAVPSAEDFTTLFTPVQRAYELEDAETQLRPVLAGSVDDVAAALGN